MTVISKAIGQASNPSASQVEKVPWYLGRYNTLLLLLCWVFIAASGLSLVTAGGGYSLATILGLLVAKASPVAEHSL